MHAMKLMAVKCVAIIAVVLLSFGGATGTGQPAVTSTQPFVQVFDSVDCPIAKLTSIGHIEADMGTPLKDGLKGLPCDAVTEGNAFNAANLQRGFDFYSWLTFIALN